MKVWRDKHRNIICLPCLSDPDNDGGECPHRGCMAAHEGKHVTSLSKRVQMYMQTMDKNIAYV